MIEPSELGEPLPPERGPELGYFNAAAGRSGPDLTGSLIYVGRLVTAFAFIVGCILCVRFVLAHGTLDHQAYRWPWMGRGLPEVASFSASTAYDLSGPLIIAGVITCRRGMVRAAWLLWLGVLLFLVAASIRSLRVLLPTLGGGFSLQYACVVLERNLLPLFLVLVLTRPAVYRRLVTPRRAMPLDEPGAERGAP